MDPVAVFKSNLSPACVCFGKLPSAFKKLFFIFCPDLIIDHCYLWEDLHSHFTTFKVCYYPAGEKKMTPTSHIHKNGSLYIGTHYREDTFHFYSITVVFG